MAKTSDGETTVFGRRPDIDMYLDRPKMYHQSDCIWTCSLMYLSVCIWTSRDITYSNFVKITFLGRNLHCKNRINLLFLKITNNFNQCDL